MIVKVCGMRNADNIREIIHAGADMIGLVFYPKSPRCVQMVNSRSGLIPDRVEQDMDDALSEASAPALVGVFVDDMPQNIITRVYNFGLDYVQLHGNESVEMIQNLKSTIVPDIRKQLKVIKAISISTADDFDKCVPYEGVADLFLFDTKCDSVGGSGNKFDWSLLQAYKGNVPFLLSGGISIEDAERIKAVSHPMFAGVDINSRFEIEPGLKDVEAVKAFLGKVKR